MKNALKVLAMALTLNGANCASNTSTIPVHPVVMANGDGKYDSIDDYVNIQKVERLEDASYMIISESNYTNSKDEKIILHSLGTAVLYKEAANRIYLATAHHVVENEKTIYSYIRGKMEKVSERFYLLDDNEVATLQGVLRELSPPGEEDKFYVEDPSGEKKNPQNMIKVSDQLAAIIKLIKPREIKTDAYNSSKDLAIISLPKFNYQPLAYTIGDAGELQTQNLIYVTGWPGGLVKNTTRGHITSVDDSRRMHRNPEISFIFDASISPGNSGGGIFAVRDGQLELVGITSAMYSGTNDLYIGIKINAISEIFKGNKILCEKGWKCHE